MEQQVQQVNDGRFQVEVFANGEQDDDVRDIVRRVAEDNVLSPKQLIVALLDASGIEVKEIALRAGVKDSYVRNLRYGNVEYKEIVQQLRVIVTQRLVEQVVDIDELFNAQIAPSVATLMEIRDNFFAKDGDRIKASIAFLDRAAKAPKATTQQNVQQMSIRIPLEGIRIMKEVMAEDERLTVKRITMEN